MLSVGEQHASRAVAPAAAPAAAGATRVVLLRPPLLVTFAVLAFAALLLIAGPPGQARIEPDAGVSSREITLDFTNFFAGTPLAGAGWAACGEPITWSVDVRALPRAERRPEVRKLRTAVNQWAAQSRLPLAFAGREALRYDPATHQLLPSNGSPVRDRHIYVGLLREGVSPLLTGSVVGLAMPSRVEVSSLQVLNGTVILRRSFVREVSTALPEILSGLHLHEFGHAFALGHARFPLNVMFPTIGAHTQLGPGDANGARAYVRPC